MKANRGSWSPVNMTAAVDAVITKSMGYQKASKEYGVPKSTLERHVQKKKKGSEVEGLERMDDFVVSTYVPALASSSSWPSLHQEPSETSHLPSTSVSENVALISAPAHLKKFTYVCSLCDSKFVTKMNWKRHMVRVHHFRASGSICYKCDRCENQKFQGLELFLEHQKSAHGFLEDFIYLQFPSTDEFDGWKLNEEQESKAHFVTQRGILRLENGETVKRYECNHKIGRACFAYMDMVTETNAKVSVVYQRAHYGHECSRPLSREYISKRERSLVSIRIRHRRATLQDCEILKKSDTVWEVRSRFGQTEERCTVEKILPWCGGACKLVCSWCRVCIHEYTCDCSDHSAFFNMCWHIHNVARKRAADQSSPDEMPMDNCTQSATAGKNELNRCESVSTPPLNDGIIKEEPEPSSSAEESLNEQTTVGESDAWNLKEDEESKARFVTQCGMLRLQNSKSIKRHRGSAGSAHMVMVAKTNAEVSAAYQRAHYGQKYSRPSSREYISKTERSLVSIRIRHRRATLQDCEILKKSDATWEVRSRFGQTEEIHMVEKILPSCGTTCKLVCPWCRVCIHEYSCDCSDHSAFFNMCWHIHDVARKCAADESSQEEMPTDDDTQITTAGENESNQNGSALPLNDGSIVKEEPLSSFEESVDEHITMGGWFLVSESEMHCKTEHVDEADSQEQ